MGRIHEKTVSGSSDLLFEVKASTDGLLNLTWNDQASATCQSSEVNACRRRLLLGSDFAAPEAFHYGVSDLCLMMKEAFFLDWGQNLPYVATLMAIERCHQCPYPCLYLHLRPRAAEHDQIRMIRPLLVPICCDRGPRSDNSMQYQRHHQDREYILEGVTQGEHLPFVHLV